MKDCFFFFVGVLFLVLIYMYYIFYLNFPFVNSIKNFILFLNVENHILEDVNKCVVALQEGDADSLDRTAGAIRGRAARYSLISLCEHQLQC